MRRALQLAAAVAVALIADGWLLLAVRHNRSEARGGRLELTERELALLPLVGDSTAVLLELRWDTLASPTQDPGQPEWLGVDKLTELGFDCRIPADSPTAPEHYAAQSARPALLVLEYEGDTWRASERTGSPPDPAATRLFVVDAGLDAEELRRRHPTPRCVIVRGLVRATLRDRNWASGEPLARARIAGMVAAIVADQIFVPRPHCALLQDLRREEAAPPAAPRYAVTVAWGANLEPWVEAVRRLGN